MTRHNNHSSSIDRRELLKGATAMGLASALAPLTGIQTTAASPGLIRAENEKTGTTDWLLTSTRVDPKTRWRCPWIEGYCSHTSIRAGERLDIMVSSNPPTAFVIDLYRLGYYGGPPRPPLLPLHESAKLEIDVMLSNLTAPSAHL